MIEHGCFLSQKIHPNEYLCGDTGFFNSLLDDDCDNSSTLIIAVVAFQVVDKINRYLVMNVPKGNPYTEKQIAEGESEDGRIESKNQQIQHLKDMLRIERDTVQSLRNQRNILKSK